MVSSGDAQTSGKVVGNSPDGSFELQGSPVGRNTSSQWDADNEVDIQPVDVFVPVRSGHWCLCDVNFLGVIFGISVGLRRFGHGRGLGGSEFGFDGQVASSRLRGRHVEDMRSTDAERKRLVQRVKNEDQEKRCRGSPRVRYISRAKRGRGLRYVEVGCGEATRASDIHGKETGRIPTKER